MSNKVEQADRSKLQPRNSGSDGVESLRGRTDIGRMGDRMEKRKQSSEVLERKERAKKRKDVKKNTEEKTNKSSILTESGGQTLLDLGRLTGYQPTTAASRTAFETLLHLLSSPALLGSQSPSILRDAAEEILAILKSDDLTDPQRQSSISDLLLGNSNALKIPTFHKMVALGKQMDDYQPNQTLEDEDKVDEEMGVAVIFDSDEEEGKDHDDEDEVVEVDVLSDSESEEEELQETSNADINQEDLDDELILQSNSSKPTKQSNQTKSRVSVHDIDAHWLQRQLSKYSKDTNDEEEMDATQAAQTANDILQTLQDSTDIRECENKLLVLLGFDFFPFIKVLLQNRIRIWASIQFKRISDQVEKEELKETLWKETTGEGKVVWEELHFQGKAEDWARERMKGHKEQSRLEAKKISELEEVESKKNEVEQEKDEAVELDLESLIFREGCHVMSSKKCELPSKSWRAMKKGYEEVHVPAVRAIVPKDEVLVNISDMPMWTQKAFAGMTKLNRIQSKLYEVGLSSSENLLLCAPTGAGKTNVAMLTMLNILGQYRRALNDMEVDDDGDYDMDKKTSEEFDLSSFKIIYVAPMKALVQEVVKNFTKRLSPYNINVRELSGDSSLTRQQIADTQVIVTTPEKWDIVTRQGEGRAYTQLVKLVIFDEIHLLADERGAVLEGILARLVRQVEATQEPIRLVGLSATLPNYKDVAALLRVKPNKGCFFFDGTYRPVPLHMQYIGTTERNAFKRFQLQNEICYQKVQSQRKRASPNQVLIFVHSRKECGKAAKALRDLAMEKDETGLFVREGGATQEILRDELAEVKNADLKEVLPYGFAVHHAGMCRSDRELVEDLFADGHIAIICCTATLAWGVNLPAHAVILRGTQIYDPKKGRWAELSPLDVLQMLGRAGRPGYDSEGEGIILTQHSELQYYLSLSNIQLPIESQLIAKLPDHLNAEVVLGNVQSIKEATEWLSYTFLYIRMIQNPALYGIHNPQKTLEKDPTLKQRRLDLAHTAACILEKSHLLRYDRRSGALQPAAMGKISSQYYINHSSMAVYSRHLRPNMTDIDLLRLFALSGEFSHITVREEEKLELAKLASKVPIPVKESPNEPSAKINILLQAYISRLKLEGFALVADMAFIQQSAARLLRALFEIALRRNWANLAKLTLAFANMISHRVWRCQSPLRQFPNVPEIVSRKLERKTDIEWSRYSDLTPSDLGELVGVPKMGRTLHKLVHRFPKLDLAAHVQPITRSMLRVELTITPDFQYDIDVHGYVLLFHIIVEDTNGESILHHEMFSLKSSQSAEEHALLFSIPILDPLPPSYFIRIISDRWMHSEAVLPISFRNMILPSRFPPPTELLDLQPLPLETLGEKVFVDLYKHCKEFNPIQTQTHSELFKTDRNVLVCAPTGSGKTICGEFAILRMITTDPKGKCVYITPKEEIASYRAKDWQNRFGKLLGMSKVAQLTGETSPDLRALAEAKIIVCTVKQWDAISRRWRQRKAVQAVTLFIADDLHFVGGNEGPIMEIVLSRMQYVSSHRKIPVRIIGLSASLANAKEVGEWIGVPAKSMFNFSPKVRPIPLEIYFQSFDQNTFSSRLMSMAKPVYSAVMKHSTQSHMGVKTNKPVLVFVPSRRQAQLTAIDFMTYRESLDNGKTFLNSNMTSEKIASIAKNLREPALQQVVMAGIGFVHAGMSKSDWETTLNLYRDNTLSVLVCPADLCWRLHELAHLVIIMGTEMYDGREKRHIDYPIANVLNMMGKTSRPNIDSSGKCVILCHSPKKEHLKKLIYDPLPVESHLDHYLHDHVNSEIVTKTISNMQDAVDYITWTLLYRRLTKNPNYYNLQGTSNVHLSEHMSEMVETVLGDLEESKCCQMTDDGDVSPLNLGMIAAYYYIQYTSIELVASSVTAKTKTRGIMEILSAASEFSTMDIRQGEERSLKMISKSLVHKLPEEAQFHDPNTKALILLQSHFSRKSLSTDLRSDQRKIISESINLIQAIVDVISSNGWLKPALAAMELSQMVVQGLWNKDHVLLQVRIL